MPGQEDGPRQQAHCNREQETLQGKGAPTQDSCRSVRTGEACPPHGRTDWGGDSSLQDIPSSAVTGRELGTPSRYDGDSRGGLCDAQLQGRTFLVRIIHECAPAFQSTLA